MEEGSVHALRFGEVPFFVWAGMVVLAISSPEAPLDVFVLLDAILGH